MRYLITFSYDGTNYNGYQKQLNKNTIQDKIESALNKITSNKIIIHASGRTDSKVHALNQKAHFDLDKEYDLSKLKKSINSLIPEDIHISKIEVVDNDFHARFNVKEKEYIYKLNIGEYNPLDRNYVYQYNKELDLDKMIEASKHLLGEHNFKSFTKTDDSKEDYIRNIYKINIIKKDNIITFDFIGNGFLRYMIRNIVGTLIEVGDNKIDPIKVKEILDSQNRKNAGKTAHPEGLYLYNVKY